MTASKPKAWAGCLLCLVLGCVPQNSLGGSISELFSLDISRVEIDRNAEAFQVSYYGIRERQTDLVLRLTVALEGVTLERNQPLLLEGEYEPGHPRATVVHLSEGEPLRILPLVKRGDIRLSSGGEIAEGTSGSFSLSFDDSNPAAFGSGRNANGTFNATVRDAGFGQEPLP